MYQKIAAIMNRDFGSSDLSAEDVENYLRYGNTDYISGDEMVQIDVLYDKFL